ncbi:MAG: Lrp/AsnC ligand binding domain-containing protein [Thermoproteota archaeon]|nr:Lrp/AsnC ligand binding domain-containing protein [Thermoproteota archaeon]
MNKISISFVLIQCAIGHEMEVLRDLLNLDSVKEAKGTFGYYDILVKIIAPTDKDIEKIVTKKIRNIKNVSTTTTISVIPEQDNM